MDLLEVTVFVHRDRPISTLTLCAPHAGETMSVAGSARLGSVAVAARGTECESCAANAAAGVGPVFELA